jgi:hypothetical protein
VIALGRNKAIIQRHYVGANDNGNLFVGIVLRPLGEEEVVTTKVYLTSKALGFAAQKLSACGFDINKQDLQILEDEPELLAGKEVEIEATEQTYNDKVYTKVEIITQKPVVDKTKLSDLTKSMRAAAVDGDKPKPPAPPKNAKPRGPAVSDVPPAKADQLDDEANAEDIPF